MGDMEDPAQLQANEVAKSLKGPLQEAIRRVERLAEEFPSEKDFHFYNNFPHFKSPVRSIQTQVEALLNDIGLAKNLRSQAAKFPSDPDDSYDWLVTLQDDLVEGIDSAVDQLNKQKSDGKRGRSYEAYQTPKKFQTGVKSNGSPSESAKASKSSERRPVPFHVRSIPRPQNKFDVTVDNSNTPFKHPQAPKPDAEKEGLSALDLHARRLGVTFDDMHPLEEELTRMEYVDEKMLEAPVPREPRPVDETPLTVVSMLSELNDMAAKCRLAGEIAVDLENHHYRSFQGFVCLMQVSTRSEDFIVDALALRSHMGPCLKDIFADVKIRKVMHGADKDIVWLQRDFGIYVCNMFDTGQAARVLQLEGCGLGFLMQHFLNINPDKRYQLADWRIRPLPAEMIKYAREDTHYLLYLYDLLRVQLVSMPSTAENDLDAPLLQVYKRSRDICLFMYKKDILTETSYLSLYGLLDKQLNPEQMSVVAGLYAWRDNLARKLDESTGFVLPNQLLYKLAEEMPDSTRSLQIAIRGPHSLVGQHVAEVVEVIKQFKEKAVASAPASSLLVLEQRETKNNSIGQTSDGLNVESDVVNKITTQNANTVAETVSASVPKPMEEDIVPASADFGDVEMKSTTVVEQHTQEEQPRVESMASEENSLKPEKAETTSIKEITVGSSMSAQVMVKRSSVEDASPASTINIRRLNAAVVKRASVPSLALFGGSSKKKGSARKVGLKIETGFVEIPNSMADSQVAKLPNESLVQATSETVTVAAVSNAVDHIKEESPATVPSTCSAGKLNSDSLEAGKGADVVPALEVQENEPATTSVGGTPCVTSEVSLGTSLNAAAEHEQGSKSVPAVEATASLTVAHSSEDVVMVAAEEVKASDSQLLNLAVPKASPVESAAAVSKPVDGGVAPRRTSGAPRQGLGSMLGSNRKRQNRANEDMEMVAAKLRASRIQASVTLPFHRIPTIGEEHIEMLSAQETSTLFSAAPGSELPNTASQPSSPSKEKSSSGQEASPMEELGDYVKIGNTERESRKRIGKDLATKNRPNWSNQFPTEEDTPLPATLSEMRRQPRHQERQQQPTDSSSAPKRKHQHHEKQKRRDVETNEDPAAGEAVFQSFDYDAARREAGLGDNFVSRIEDSQAGRGRGRGRPVNPNKRQRQVAPSSTNGPVQPFDPLRRVRQEPRPEGIPAAKRRQVFPQTGNRTQSFKR